MTATWLHKAAKMLATYLNASPFAIQTTGAMYQVNGKYYFVSSALDLILDFGDCEPMIVKPAQKGDVIPKL